MGKRKDYRYGHHTVSRLSAHIVWVTKYRYKVLTGDIKKRVREIVIQVAEAEDVRILEGVVSSDHVHIHIEYPPKLAISELMKAIKGRSSRLIQREYKSLAKRYWGKHFWAIGYGVWSTGNITDEMVKAYLKHHEGKADREGYKDFIIEKEES